MYNDEHIQWINQKYKKSYREINNSLKQIVDNKKYFIGSHDELGYYQPDLTDLLIDDNSRMGRFVSNTPRKKKYFEYWYANNNLIKIKYITDDDYENYDVIVQREDDKTLYLFYSLDNNGEVSLSNFYILTYDDDKLIALDKYIKWGSLDKYSYCGAEYFYSNTKLNCATIFANDCFSQKRFKFEYDSSGKIQKCLLVDGVHEYNLDVKDKIDRFHKFGLYHLG